MTPARQARRRAGVALTLLLAILVLDACGKRGEPSPPPDEPNVFPRVYPRQ